MNLVSVAASQEFRTERIHCAGLSTKSDTPT